MRTRFSGEVLPNQISEKIGKLARQNGSRIPRTKIEKAKRDANGNGANGEAASKQRSKPGSPPRGGSDLSRALRETILALQKLETAPRPLRICHSVLRPTPEDRANPQLFGAYLTIRRPARFRGA
jgi:hypothetical protein